MRVLSIVGTRPEAIKMAPVIKEIERRAGLHSIVLTTGQHREMLDQVLEVFSIAVDSSLDIMTPGQTLNQVFSRVMTGVDNFLAENPVDLVLVHGDTTTAAAAALAAFHRGVPIGHVEAGLRTGDLARPFPEEMNRCVVDVVAELLFAPTASSARNLEATAIKSQQIHVTGNTVIDALLSVSARIDADAVLRARLERNVPALPPQSRLVLVTGHRRESFGKGVENLCDALADIASLPDVDVVYPVHLNPNVKGPVNARLGGHPNIHLIPPQDYLTFVHLMKRASLIITDSGGIQEEAPSLGVPVLVTRTVTERPEALSSGRVQLVGPDRDAIFRGAAHWLERSHGKLDRTNPYGDGRASIRIADAILEHRQRRLAAAEQQERPAQRIAASVPHLVENAARATAKASGAVAVDAP
ncbi:MAG: UDP-N-acetylglucosamine 2-epimerase (non-hydrolyzing) [Hyphomicrobiaceae bacterium]|nr:UDP-N-acetylglucosamine 2-epimerase (non-hydrolyzing) [Hyphomicrobiaceae bacterium]